MNERDAYKDYDPRLRPKPKLDKVKTITAIVIMIAAIAFWAVIAYFIAQHMP